MSHSQEVAQSPKSSTLEESASESRVSIPESSASEESAPEPSVSISLGRSSKTFRLMQRNLRIAGEAYVTSSQKRIPAKQQPSDGVTCKCQFLCKKLAESQMKRKLFAAYHKLSKNEQRNFLMGLIAIIPVGRRRHGTYENPAESRRQCSIRYTLPDKTGAFLRVCRKTFLETFQISDKKLTTLIARKKCGESTFVEQPSTSNKKPTTTVEDQE